MAAGADGRTGHDGLGILPIRLDWHDIYVADPHRTIALTVFGIAWLVRNGGNSTTPSSRVPAPIVKRIFKPTGRTVPIAARH